MGTAEADDEGVASLSFGDSLVDDPFVAVRALDTESYTAAVPPTIFCGHEVQLFNSPDLIGKGFEDVEFLGHTLTFTRATYYLTWAIALVLLVVAWLVLRGGPGRAFRAVRDSELAATSSGVNIAAYKTFAFALSAAYAGVAGSLSVIAVAFADPNGFRAGLSLTILVGAVVAGLGSLWGVLIGAAFVQFLPDAAVHISKAQGVPDAVYGAAQNAGPGRSMITPMPSCPPKRAITRPS